MSSQAVPQHMVALARANEVRVGHAAVKREVKAGVLSFGDALVDSRAASLPVLVLLLSVWRVGKKKAHYWCAMVPVSPLKRVGLLTERQRSELVGLVEGNDK